MPRVLEAYVRNIESFNVRVGKIFAGGLFVMVFILLLEAVSRYVFEYPTPWSVELTMFVFGTYFFIGGGYVLLRGGHVKMDAIYSRWSPKRRAITDLATFSLAAFYLVTFIVGGIADVTFTIKFDQHYATMWGPPLAPIKIIVLVGGIILLLQAAAFFIRDLSLIKGKPIQ